MNTFPDDDNGDALRRMQSHGDDLSRPRDIDFTVIFPNQSAERFATYFRELGFTATAELTHAQPELPWDVLVVNHMIPTHADVVAFERTLEVAATPLGGRYDGWGCLSQ